MNPYDFVQLPKSVARQNVLTHHKFQGCSGKIRCRLTAITPIFIPQNLAIGSTQRFMTARYNGKDLPVIPGSSLKGVIRCVAEAVSLSCIGLSGELFDRGSVSSRYQGRIDKIFSTCDQRTNLCPACRLFGMVSSQSHFLGKVAFSDARTEEGKFQHCSPMILKPLMEPKPRHTAFYQPNDKVAGRKFYFHHGGTPKTTLQATEFTKTVVPLEGLDPNHQPRTVFEFVVTYNNLTDDEFSLLLFSLFLTDEMCHKVGGGKPNGLGTAKIEAIEVNEIEPLKRYRGLGTRAADEQTGKVSTGEKLEQRIETLTASITSEPSPSLQDLQRIWMFPAATDRTGNHVDYRYPDQNWFGANSAKPIADTP